MKKTMVAMLLMMILVLEVFAPFSSAVSSVSSQTVIDRLNSTYIGKEGYSNYAGYCLSFVADFWAGMGFTRRSANDAYSLACSLTLNNNYDIPIGADVFFDGWGKYNDGNWYEVGHIGIYVGDGYFASAVWDFKNTIQKRKISEYKTYTKNGASTRVQYMGWAWHPGISVVSTSITPTVTFSPWSNDNYTYIGYTDAAPGQQIDVSGGTCTKTGMYLYDANGNYLAEGVYEGYNYRMFFEANSECHYTLEEETTYQYKFYAVVNGVTYWGPMYSFTTLGEKKKPTVTFSPWSNDNYTYIGYTDAAPGQQIDVSDGTCTQMGMYLYDANGNYLTMGAWDGYYYRVYFKVNEECNYVLTPGTTYQYKFFAVVNGEIYWGPMASFKTIGVAPTPIPTAAPTAAPTAKPTAAPTVKPTAVPTAKPTAKPTAAPTAKPTAVPTAKPTAAPTAKPTTVPTAKPTTAPTAAPVSEPTVNPGKSEEMSEEERAAKTLADKTAAAEVLAQISTLPESAGTADKAAVEAARAAYNALTDDQKALVSIDALRALLTAEKQVEKAENATPVPTAPPKPAKEKLSKAKITVKAQTYTGKAIKPAVTVKLNGKTLKKGTDYTVSYKNNKAVGKATVTVKGKGNYTGTAKKAFRINPKAVKGLALKAGSKKLTVTWKKAAGVTGYEVQYALKKDFKGAKKVTVKKDKTVKTALKSLKAGKTYYVRIRAYKTVKKVKYYSAWSKAVKAKAK